jgi:hypothetical protein
MEKYQLLELLADKDIDESLKCGICMDILRMPILCVSGHSWCKECIKGSRKKICPTCRQLIDHETSGIDH